MRTAAERGDAISGIPTGFPDLDKRIAGLHDGDLLIVAARPGMGKSALLTNIAVNIASPEFNAEGTITTPGDGAVVFSLEMPKAQLTKRITCAEARIDLQKVRTGFLNKEDWGGLTSAAGHLATLPIWIDDAPNLTLLGLRSKVRRVQAEAARRRCPRCNGTGTAQKGDCNLCGGVGAYPLRIGMVGVDYLQLMKVSQLGRSREQDVSEISRGLKGLAKELDVPVVALSQLNRGVETRGGKDKRPMLADLRESGAIEQDADTIIFVYRDEYYNPDTTDAKGLAELIVAKQRNGPTGKIMTRFTGSYTRFDTLANYDHEDYQ
jgi:replicative DNA helicase